jgi:pimeloyl-ACP methyl ester carboxylesterase
MTVISPSGAGRPDRSQLPARLSLHPVDIPGVQCVEILDDAGHLVMEDHPGRVAEILSKTTTVRILTTLVAPH